MLFLEPREFFSEKVYFPKRSLPCYLKIFLDGKKRKWQKYLSYFFEIFISQQGSRFGSLMFSVGKEAEKLRFKFF